MKIVNSLPRDKWMSFVNSHPSANIFHTSYMMDVFKRAKDHLPFLSAAINEKDEICGLILSVQVKTLGSFLTRYSSRAVVYGGILWESSCESNDGLMELIAHYDSFVRRRLLFTEIRNMDVTVNIRNHLRSSGYQYEDYLNYLIDLTRDEQTIFRSFSKSRKSGIKRAERIGCSVEEVKDIKNLFAFYGIIRETYSRIKVPLADFSLFESAYNHLYNVGHIKVFLARYKGSFVSAIALLIFKGVVLTWYCGSYRNELLPSPVSLLIWHTIKWAKANNCHTLDFGGAGRPNEKYGVRDFKARFGGNLVNYGRYYKVYSPFRFKISRKAYQILWWNWSKPKY
jgi:serine/alanine adding enzyme